ncbi:Phosphate-binding protein PstS 3 precursor [Isoptericola dokdonensis DS-3]|jgi:phosphate transport system substrate-binding protein|uniref:Phosphate-binding protein n=1 Tax=Isoptericola dokdonensis DS-3 TaxID=1300344 RepID=A0A161I3F1_9MICO|nr:phosphate ABC transporter substrate-binding protein PstS [Isoptericola dokdonensis]ANC32555.1 Phosphate-binding protein PstS 3 precursor [Isoptericola dokdonensis DS-3]
MERLVNLSRFTRAGSAVAVGVLALSLAACGSDPEPAGGETAGSDTGESMAAEGGLSGELSGGGASSQEAAMNAWRAGFQQANPDATINYDPVGSGGGRTGFGDGSYAFAGSDAALDEEEMAAAEAQCGEGGVIQFPGYVSPIAIAFNLDGVDSLNMSPETIANVFLGEITTWNDEAIAADNPDAELPDTAITVVHRSDESGTTENFEEYLYTVAPDTWTEEPSGVWPVDGQESAQGTSGVIGAAQAGQGTITYADASQVADLGTVAVGVGSDFVSYSAEAAAEVVAQSPRVEGTGEYVYTIELQRDIEGTYPVVLVSYTLACGTYADEAQAELVKGFVSYIASEEGQEAAAAAAGSAPLSDTIRQAVQPGIDAIAAG